MRIGGSPPRVRGKRSPPCFPECTYRITPARAGKTLCLRVGKQVFRDHPRACGENFPDDYQRVLEWGSPPRVRGKPCNPKAGWRAMRITPARAGKTRAKPQSRAAGSDHPRACGENLRGAAARPDAGGSPLRVRGKHPRACPPMQPRRITPARAGKT